MLDNGENSTGPYSRTSYDISQASDWSRLQSRPIRSLRYIVTCTRVRALAWESWDYMYTVKQLPWLDGDSCSTSCIDTIEAYNSWQDKKSLTCTSRLKMNENKHCQYIHNGAKVIVIFDRNSTLLIGTLTYHKITCLGLPAAIRHPSTSLSKLEADYKSLLSYLHSFS